MKFDLLLDNFVAKIIDFNIDDFFKNKSLQDELKEAIVKYKVILIPKQNLTLKQEQELANIFPHVDKSGPYRKSFQKWKILKYPHIQVQGWGNIKNHHNLEGIMKPKISSLEWHTDGIHETLYPPYLTQIYCINTPLEGGDTLFMDTSNIWEKLSDVEKHKYGNLRINYKQIKNKMDKNGCLCLSGISNVSHSPEIDNNKLQSKNIQQPLFHKIPETNTIAMSVAPMYMSHIENYSFKKSAKLIESLIKKSLNTVYCHKYQPGDIVLFDNRQCLHSATINLNIDINKSNRLLHRIRMDSSQKLISL